MTHFNKGRKQKPEHIAKRTEAVRAAMKRPEVKAKMIGRACSTETRTKIGIANSKKLKGRKLSEAHRASMSKERKERWARWKEDPERMAQHKEKLSKALKGKYTGEAASNWKGGINQNERTDNRIFDFRNVVLVRDNYTCQICQKYGGDMHIDHIKSWADYPELRFEVSNGRTLCRPCHYWVTFRRKMPEGSGWGLVKRQVGIKDLS